MDEEDPIAAEHGSHVTRGRGRIALTGIAGVITLVAAAAVAVTLTRNGGHPTADAKAETTEVGSWARLPNPPLSPRADARVAWTGTEVIVLGGTEFACPPGAGCSAPTDPPRGDGAAYDPAVGTWRRIADMPVVGGGQPAVVDGKVFLLASCSSAGDGATEASSGSGRCAGSDEPTILLRYDPARDVWTQLPGLPDGNYSLTAASASLLAYAMTDEAGEAPDWRFDIATTSWAKVPDDPLPPVFDRSMVVADDGERVFLFGARIASVAEPKDEPILAASLDLESLTWTEVAPSPSRGFRAWGVDELVVLEPHFGGNGGIFDPATNAWSPLPAEGGSFDSNHVAGTFGRSDAVYTDATGWLFDLTARNWMKIAPLDDRDFHHSGITAAGRDLFLFGGVNWRFAKGHLLGDAWLWHPPGDPSGAISPQDTPSTVSTTTSLPPIETSAEVFGGLTVRLDFDATEVVSGGELPSKLVIENRSGQPATDPGCVLGASPYALIPADDPYAELWLTPVVGCVGAHIYEPGFTSTSQHGPEFPARTKFGDPLPPGDYLAAFDIDGHRLGYPVTVVP